MALEIKTILVTCAAGKQGRMISHLLLEHGFGVTSLVRDRDVPAARKLAAAGAKLAEGDLDDPASLADATASVDAVFIVLPPEWSPTAETDALEFQRGRNIVDAAKAANVKYLVYSSVGAADKFADIRPGHKFDIENYVWKSGIDATVLRPVAFMENYIDQAATLQSGVLYDPTAPDIRVDLISVRDIAAFGTLAFEDPEHFRGKTLEIAGDRKRPQEIAEKLAHALETPIAYHHMSSRDLHNHNAILGRMYDYLNTGDYAGPDLSALREMHPGLLDLQAWLDQGGSDAIGRNFESRKTTAR